MLYHSSAVGGKMSQLKIISLGGVNENGMNMYLVEVEEAIIVLDAGLKYPEEEMLGVDILVQDVTYLEQNANRVKAIFLSHAHEDNIGAVGYLLSKVKAPILSSKLTRVFIEELIQERELNIKDFKFFEINDRFVYKVTPQITIDFFNVSHSIPGSYGAAVNTPYGTVVYATDFNFDQNNAEQTSISKLVDISKRNVVALLIESINAEKALFASSEVSLLNKVEKEMENAEGRIIISTFASNVNALQRIINLAIEHKRSIFLSGQSILTVFQKLEKVSALTYPKGLFKRIADIDTVKDHEALIVASGVLGEPFEALMDMAKGYDDYVSLRETDCILFASKPLPGTELLAAKTEDAIARTGATTKKVKLTVTSHACSEDIKLILNILRPKAVIPIKGPYRKQIALAKIAKELNYKEEEILIPDAGQVIVSEKGMTVLRKEFVPAGFKTILGNAETSIDAERYVIKDREQLSDDGVLVAVMTISSVTRELVAQPVINSRGFVQYKESKALIIAVSKLVQTVILENKELGDEDLKFEVKKQVQGFVRKEISRTPMVLPILMVV